MRPGRGQVVRKLRNRIVVVIAWMWAYLTFRSGSRLITGRDVQEKPATTGSMAA